MLKKVINILAAILFAVFAYLQINDIDPAVYHKASSLDAALWCAFYFLIAVLFVVCLFRNIPSWLLILAVIACLVEMAFCAPGLIENLTGDEEFNMTQVSMSAEDPRVELSREFFGALIALVGVLAIWWQQKKRGPANSSE